MRLRELIQGIKKDVIITVVDRKDFIRLKKTI